MHPEAHRASIRELGLQSVPVDQIRGTAVEGPASAAATSCRCAIGAATTGARAGSASCARSTSSSPLPPVELIKFGDDYWVVDGHNRVAAALYTGQDEVDAVVQELRLPGMPVRAAAADRAVLEGSLDLRDAGAGRLTRTQRPADPSCAAHADAATTTSEPE